MTKKTNKEEKEKRSLISFLYRGSTVLQVCGRPIEQCKIQSTQEIGQSN
jgi:hypothetical protein